MAYKQKKPTFFKSALKQYYNYENESKKEISKEEFIKLSNQGAHVGSEGQVAIDLWKSSLSGKTGIHEIDGMSKHEKQSEYSRALKKYQKPQRNLTQEEMDSAEEVSPMKATPGYEMLMQGAGGSKGKGRKGSGYYTSGDLSYRGEWNTDLISGDKKKEETPKEEDLVENGEDKPADDSSTKINWPKKRNKNNTSQQNDYITTACPVFGEPGSANYRAGMLENKRNMTPREWRLFKKQQKNKFETPMGRNR